MAFDKTKAMRNAERYLAQGKIRSAINEYKQVVEHDPKDFGTMNLLGDLYSKASEPRSAVTYYTIVAEHYSKQGFNQKAIAVYNKIAKIQPNSVDVSEKLAQLYKSKGSVKEAKSHYVVLAESYQAKGRITEALAMWKQIAILDPNNTEVFPTIAEMHLEQGEDAEASDAFAEAGNRYIAAGRTSEAVDSFNRALGIDFNNAKALRGLVDATVATGNIHNAIEQLRGLYNENPGQTGILAAMVDAHLRAEDPQEAEKTVIRLVEQEPASYSKLLDVAHYYLAKQDFDAASRMLSMASEHMLAGGQAETFSAAVNAVLEHRPEQLEALRLFVRYCTWQRDEAALKDSLQRLARVARKEESVDDERYALSQLVIVMPQDASFAERLREINALHGFEDEIPAGNGLFDERFYKASSNGSGDISAVPAETIATAFELVGAVIESSNGEMVSLVEGVDGDAGSFEIASDFAPASEPALENATEAEAEDESPEARLRREAESIRFYVDNGYVELAQKAIIDLESEFGNVPELADLRKYLGQQESIETIAATPEPPPADAAAVPVSTNSGLFDLGELRSELGLEEPESVDDSDYETKYQTAIAYQEMGLLEQAIAEFQDAAALVTPNDGTRRFFSCANLLGLCFMQSGMPKLAIKWYERALEIKNLNGDERQALWYELGLAFEAEGEAEEAERLFEQVYAENVDYRDVRSRLKNMMVTQ
jgi:tetratricopeptide (TPR) repeat protein